MGFLHALQVIWVHGFRHVWFEGDNLQLTTLINKIEDHHLIGTLLQDIRVWMAKLPLSSLGHVNREANVATDTLSRYATSMTNLYQIFNVPPRWLLNCLKSFYTINPSQMLKENKSAVTGEYKKKREEK